MTKKEQYPLKHLIWLLVIGSALILGLAFLIGCSDDGDTFVIAPDPVPKKCLEDPCPDGELLRACEVHGYVCPPPLPSEPCRTQDKLACRCEDPAENPSLCDSVPEF